MDAMLIMEIANILSTMQTVCPWRKCVRSSEKVVYMELAQRLLLGWESSLANHQGDGGGIGDKNMLFGRLGSLSLTTKKCRFCNFRAVCLPLFFHDGLQVLDRK